MKPIFGHIKLVCMHKWFVFRAGLRTGAPLYRLIIHDWSKFSPLEAPHYARQFFGDKSDPLGFSYAWNHHQKINKHHWEYWVPVSGHNRGGYKDGEPLPMPEPYVREMVADWLGATRAYQGFMPSNRADWTWLNENLDKIRVHVVTRTRIEKVLNEIF